MKDAELEKEAERLTELLKGKMVKQCIRHKTGELVVIFKNGMTLFVNADTDLEFSVTGGNFAA